MCGGAAADGAKETTQHGRDRREEDRDGRKIATGGRDRDGRKIATGGRSRTSGSLDEEDGEGLTVRDEEETNPRTGRGDCTAMDLIRVGIFCTI